MDVCVIPVVPDYSRSMNPWDLSPLQPPVEHSPPVATPSPYISPAWSPALLTSPANTTSLDIEPLDYYPIAATAPESSSKIPVRMCTTDDPFEEEWLTGESLEELSPGTSTITPGTSLVKYGAPIPRSLSVGSPVLAMCCSQDLTIPMMTPKVSPGIGTSLISYL